MTYYTIELSDGFTNWIHNTTTNFTRKFNTFEEAREAAELLLKCPSVTKYSINKFEQEVVRIKDKEPPVPKTEKRKDKIIYFIQYESCIPYKWIDMKIEFTNKDHAQLILEHQSKMSSDTAYRLVQREYSYEELVIKD